MSMRFALFPVLLAAVLAACSTRHETKIEPPAEDVTPGSTFTVVKDFLIPSGDSSVYFQDARLYPQGKIQVDDPVCRFITGIATEDGQVITTRVLTVSNVSYDENGVGPGGASVSVTALQLQDPASGKSYRMNCMLPLASRGPAFSRAPGSRLRLAGIWNSKSRPGGTTVQACA